MNTYLCQTGNYFQSYIRRGLSNLAAEDKELHAAAVAASAASSANASMVASPNQEHHQSYASNRSITPTTADARLQFEQQQQQHLHQQQQQQQVQRQSFESPQPPRNNEVRSSMIAGAGKLRTIKHCASF